MTVVFSVTKISVTGKKEIDRIQCFLCLLQDKTFCSRKHFVAGNILKQEIFCRGNFLKQEIFCSMKHFVAGNIL